jgi:Transcriptional regulators of sugar metabolism
MNKSKLLQNFVDNNAKAYMQVVLVDIVNFSKRSTITQIEILDNFSKLITTAINKVEAKNLVDIKKLKYDFSSDIIKIPTGDGILIAMPFQSLRSPHLDFAIELLTAIQIMKDEKPCPRQNTKGHHMDENGFCTCGNYFDVRIGINEGQAIVYKDLNGNFNVAGDIINNTERIMSPGDAKTILMGNEVYKTLMQYKPHMLEDISQEIKITDKHGNTLLVHQYRPKNMKCINYIIPDKIQKEDKMYQMEEKYQELDTKYKETVDIYQSLIMAGMIHGDSVFGTRISHFFLEKKILAKRTIDIIINDLIKNNNKKVCLLIDSGTTTYHLFTEICERIKEYQKYNSEINSWIERIFIISNNLPGIQFLMKNCRKGCGEYSDLLIKCLLIPGKPLPVYAAVVGKEATEFLYGQRFTECIKKELKLEDDKGYEIIAIMSANYMVRHPTVIDNKILFCPAARGGEEGGHFEIKEAFAKLSNKIYLISPLTKFSFATCNSLNKINDLDINELEDIEKTRASPDRVRYREVLLTESELIEKCNFILTNRKENDHFGKFAKELADILNTSYPGRIEIVDYNIEAWIPNGLSKLERDNIALAMEIPHEKMKSAYSNYKNSHNCFIWDKKWIDYDKDETIVNENKN